MSHPTPTARSDGIIAEDSRRRLAIFWAASFVLVGLLLPLMISSVIHKPRDLMAWVTTLVLAGFIAWSIARAIRLATCRQKFGLATLELETNPGAIGGQLAGAIVTGKPVQFDAEIRLTLACLDREVVGSGKNTHAVYSTQWRDHYFLTHKLPMDGEAVSMPVFFEIPTHCHPTERISAKERIVWRLTADSAAGGTPFHVEFTVPVLEVAQETQLPDAAAGYRVPAPAASSAPGRGVSITESSGDELDITFSAARHPLLALEYTGYAALFVAAPIVLSQFRVGHVALIVLGVIFGLIALVIFPSAFGLWFSRSRVSVRFKTLELTRGRLFFWQTRHFEPKDIASIKSSMSLSDLNQEQLYSLELKTRQHRCVTIAGALSRHDADLIAVRLRKAMDIAGSHRSAKKNAASAS